MNIEILAVRSYDIEYSLRLLMICSNKVDC